MSKRETYVHITSVNVSRRNHSSFALRIKRKLNRICCRLEALENDKSEKAILLEMVRISKSKNHGLQIIKGIRLDKICICKPNIIANYLGNGNKNATKLVKRAMQLNASHWRFGP